MLNIFVNTWGNYNENGADGGEWITLPMDADELKEKLQAIAEAMNDNDPEWLINDYEWTCEWEGREIDENESIFELNKYVTSLDELDECQQTVYAAAVEYWGYEYIDVEDVDDYNLYTDIHNEYDLGYYWAVESGCYEIDEKSPLSRYFDYEAFGRDINIEADGGFTSYGFIERC